MIKAKVSTDYKDIERIFAGGTIQKEILKVWSTEANAYVFEAWKILEMEGPLPLTFKANGEPLIDYRIYGNTVQNGTPTPENPIIPESVGERTENLLPFDDKNFVINAGGSNLIVECKNGDLYMKGTTTEIITTNARWKTNFTFELEAGTYYCNSPSPLSGGFGRYIKKYDDNSNMLKANEYTFTITENTKCYLSFYIYNKSINSKIELMLNLGSTALPYEPYGYKLPMVVSDGNTVQTVPIYLGEVETTRRIKKLVLTGEESDWRIAGEGNTRLYNHTIRTESSYNSEALCNVAVYSDFVTTSSGVAFDIVAYRETLVLRYHAIVYTTLNDFKSYLAQQYAAGTPVTVWYVLAEPETGVVNEPLMKIGDYADTINSTQANVQIPTSKGTTILDYDGEDHFITSDGYELVDKNQNGFLLSGSTLRPSKMHIKYKGR